MTTTANLDQTQSIRSLRHEAESRTNHDNIKCLAIFASILVLCNVLNEIGVFYVSPIVMRIGVAIGTISFLIPVLFLARPLKLFGKRTDALAYQKWHKYFILAFAWLGTFVACITLTHHTVIIMAIPIIFMAQYHNTKKLIVITTVLGTLCVLLGVYGGYFWGCFDANLLHLAVTDENVADLALRAKMATPKRMLDLLTHYALARELVVLSLIFLATKISKRSDEMLDRQAELQQIVEKEMRRTNVIQRQIIDSMANLIENRDSSTGEHVKRTSFYVRSIVRRLQLDSPYSNLLSDQTADTIVRAAPLHDIGKIVVADRILLKPGKLTPAEFEEIKLHAAEGASVIKNVLGYVEDDDFLRCATEIAGGHHERWDGNGYPSGISGDSIPLSARIMAVADVFDALVSKRVYKEAFPPAEAFSIIESESGKQFDPVIVRAFLSLRLQILASLTDNSNSLIL